VNVTARTVFKLSRSIGQIIAPDRFLKRKIFYRWPGWTAFGKTEFGEMIRNISRISLYNRQHNTNYSYQPRRSELISYIKRA